MGELRPTQIAILANGKTVLVVRHWDDTVKASHIYEERAVQCCTFCSAMTLASGFFSVQSLLGSKDVVNCIAVSEAEDIALTGSRSVKKKDDNSIGGFANKDLAFVYDQKLRDTTVVVWEVTPAAAAGQQPPVVLWKRPQLQLLGHDSEVC